MGEREDWFFFTSLSVLSSLEKDIAYGGFSSLKILQHKITLNFQNGTNVGTYKETLIKLIPSVDLPLIAIILSFILILFSIPKTGVKVLFRGRNDKIRKSSPDQVTYL